MAVTLRNFLEEGSLAGSLRITAAVTYNVGDAFNNGSICGVNVLNVLGKTGSSKMIVSSSEKGFADMFLQQTVYKVPIKPVDWSAILRYNLTMYDSYCGINVIQIPGITTKVIATLFAWNKRGSGPAITAGSVELLF